MDGQRELKNIHNYKIMDIRVKIQIVQSSVASVYFFGGLVWKGNMTCNQSHPCSPSVATRTSTGRPQYACHQSLKKIECRTQKLMRGYDSAACSACYSDLIFLLQVLTRLTVGSHTEKKHVHKHAHVHKTVHPVRNTA